MYPWREGAFRVSAGFCLLTAWFGIVNGWRVLAVVLSAAAIHEVGHCLAIWCLGGSVAGLRLSVFGAELELISSRLSYGKELLCILAGPAANLLCPLLFPVMWNGKYDVFIGANLVLCAFNLLPVRPLDGGRAVFLLVSWLAGPTAGERAARLLGAITAALLAAMVIWLMWCTGGSLWLVPAAVGFIVTMWRESLGKGAFL